MKLINGGVQVGNLKGQLGICFHQLIEICAEHWVRNGFHFFLQVFKKYEFSSNSSARF
jgi:hypothetical protein